MVTFLQIAIVLLIMALVGMILGYLIGNLSCRKITKNHYIEKGKYCETEYAQKQGLNEQIENSELDQLKDDLSNTQEPKVLENESSAESSIVKDEAKKDSDASSILKDMNSNPKFLEAPLSDKKVDNLCEIKGIGAVIDKKLKNLGVYYFEQIATWSSEDIDKVDSHLAFSGRITREKWVEQAKKLSMGKKEIVLKKSKKSEVESSKQY